VKLVLSVAYSGSFTLGAKCRFYSWHAGGTAVTASGLDTTVVRP